MATQVRRVRASVDQATDPDGDRYYAWGGKNYWSVTTILGAMPKYWMKAWASKQVAEYAIGHVDLITMMMAQHPPKEVIDWLKRAPDRTRDAGADIGAVVHEAAEAHALGRPYPEWTDVQRPYMEGYLRWLDDWQPTFLAIEAPVFSHKHRYAGTLDAIVEVDGVRLLIDYKTTRSGVFAETGLQLASYRYSEMFVGLPDGDEEPTPPVDGVAVVHLRPEGYKFVPLRADRQVFDTFLYAREVFRWTKEIQRTIVGKAALPAARTCARSDCGHHTLMHGKNGCMAVRSFVETDREVVCPCAGFRIRPLKAVAS